MPAYSIFYSISILLLVLPHLPVRVSAQGSLALPPPPVAAINITNITASVGDAIAGGLVGINTTIETAGGISLNTDSNSGGSGSGGISIDSTTDGSVVGGLINTTISGGIDAATGIKLNTSNTTPLKVLSPTATKTIGTLLSTAVATTTAASVAVAVTSSVASSAASALAGAAAMGAAGAGISAGIGAATGMGVGVGAGAGTSAGASAGAGGLSCLAGLITTTQFFVITSKVCHSSHSMQSQHHAATA